MRDDAVDNVIHILKLHRRRHKISFISNTHLYDLKTNDLLPSLFQLLHADIEIEPHISCFTRSSVSYILANLFSFNFWPQIIHGHSSKDGKKTKIFFYQPSFCSSSQLLIMPKLIFRKITPHQHF